MVEVTLVTTGVIAAILAAIGAADLKSGEFGSLVSAISERVDEAIPERTPDEVISEERQRRGKIENQKFIESVMEEQYVPVKEKKRREEEEAKIKEEELNKQIQETYRKREDIDEKEKQGIREERNRAKKRNATNRGSGDPIPGEEEEEVKTGMVIDINLEADTKVIVSDKLLDVSMDADGRISVTNKSGLELRAYPFFNVASYKDILAAVKRQVEVADAAGTSVALLMETLKMFNAPLTKPGITQRIKNFSGGADGEAGGEEEEVEGEEAGDAANEAKAALDRANAAADEAKAASQRAKVASEGAIAASERAKAARDRAIEAREPAAKKNATTAVTSIRTTASRTAFASMSRSRLLRWSRVQSIDRHDAIISRDQDSAAQRANFNRPGRGA